MTVEFYVIDTLLALGVWLAIAFALGFLFGRRSK